jgi:16S rRNA (guanine527-N7)-methyltransferase
MCPVSNSFGSDFLGSNFQASDFREDLLARLLDAALAEFSFSISIEQRSQLLTYAALLKHSQRHSFASWDSDEEGFAIHFRDSFFTIPKKAPTHFLDVGSGAGIPGIIYAIFWPNTQAVLLDSQKKRCAFMEECLLKLKLQNHVSVLCGRAESLVNDPALREKFDWVTARALAPFPQFLKTTAGFVRVGGTLHALRGEKDSKILSEYAALLKAFHLKIMDQNVYQLNPPKSRFIFLFQKTAEPINHGLLRLNRVPNPLSQVWVKISLDKEG